MTSFRSQMMKDLTVFHNSAEFAEAMTVYYGDRVLYVKGVMDNESGAARKQAADDYAPGINRIGATLYLPLTEAGFVPERGNEIEIEQAGSVRPYMIEESAVQDGEIILTLGAYDE